MHAKQNETKTFSAMGKTQSAINERTKLPHLHEEIKSLKDGLYSVLRVAWLPQWSYYILETNRFRKNLKPIREKELCSNLFENLNANREMWFLIQGMEFSLLDKGSDGKWIKYEREASISYVWEGAIEAYLPIPKDLDIDWEEHPF